MSLGLTRLGICIRPAAPGGAGVPVKGLFVPDADPLLMAPRNTRLPQLTGGNTVGSVLQSNSGVWEGNPGPSHTWAWLRDGSAIPGETGTRYTIQIADEGHGIQAEITATNSQGSAKAVSRIIDVLVSVPPAPDMRVPPAP